MVLAFCPNDVTEYTHTRGYTENIDEDKQLPVSDPADRNLMLVVEDNHEILNYICQSLKSFFNTIGARNGEEGLHLAKMMNS
jgi:hypothetical protein